MAHMQTVVIFGSRWQSPIHCRPASLRFATILVNVDIETIAGLRQLGMHRQSLQQKMAQLGIERS